MKWQSRLLVLLATATCAVYAQAGGRWFWPDEAVSAPRNTQSTRDGAGRRIQGQPGFAFNSNWPGSNPVQFISFNYPHKTSAPEVTPQKAVQVSKAIPGEPSPRPVPVSGPPVVVTREPVTPPSSGLLSTTKGPESPVVSTDDDNEGPSKEKKNSSVPLLADAGKPGNPYELLNRIFPPEQRIRTKEEEEANLNSLANEDLGGLDPHEVYVADSDLFVIRGFNFKKPYNPDPPGPPISDYEAPAPNPPPPPEPGTVFYPVSNDTDELPGFPFPNFNETDFSPFIPAGLGNGTGGGIPFLPFPFLPPPPPHHDSTKQTDPFGEFPFPPFGNQGQGPPGAPGNFPPGNPGSVPPEFQNGFGPGRPGAFPPGPAGSFPPGPPGSFPPGPPGSFPPGPQGSFPPVPPPPSGLPPSVNGSSSVPPNIPEFIFPGNFTEDDDSVPFTPLFPERPVEYYYPTHNTTEIPPGPFGPGIFVPPPAEFFSRRNQSEDLKVRIPSALFKPPFNLPNYYEKKTVKENIKPNRPFAVQQPQNQPVIPKQGERWPAHPFLQNNIPFIQHVRVVSDQHVPLRNQQHQPANQRLPPAIPLNHRPIYGGSPVTFGRPPPSATKPVSLESDINVNFKFPRPEINPDSELVDVSLLQPAARPTAPKKPAPHEANKPLKYIQSHRLPGATLQLQPSREAYVSVYRNGAAGSYSYSLS